MQATLESKGRYRVEQAWQTRLAEVSKGRPAGGTLAAFNLNVDVVARVTPEAIERLVETTPDLDWEEIDRIDVDALRSIRTREEFLAVLRRGFATGKSNLLVREDESIVAWWEGLFDERQESMGGQAGIIANQMAALGARSLVYSPLLSPKQASLFLPGVLWPKRSGAAVEPVEARTAGREGDPTREPWVFEYRKGERFRFPDRTFTTPRANRAIITTGIQGPERRFHDDVKPALAELGRAVDVGFMAGYHQCGNNPGDPEAVRAYFRSSVEELRQLKAKNPRLKLHVEYVPAKVREMELECYRTLGEQIDSFGINETELRAVLDRFGYPEIAAELEGRERAFLLYKGALTLLRLLGVERVHVHNLGYYVVVLKKPYSRRVEIVRDACLFASAVNARKAQEGGYVAIDDVPAAGAIPLSEVGFEQLRTFAEEALQGRPQDVIDRFLTEGIVEEEDHYVLVTPAHIVPNPVVTVGMGDTISSSAYFYETCFEG